jgi:hypothetical protein
MDIEGQIIAAAEPAIDAARAKAFALAEDLRARLASVLPGSVGRGVEVKPGSPVVRKSRGGKSNMSMGGRIAGTPTVEGVAYVEVPFPYQFHEFGYMLEMIHRPGVKGKLKWKPPTRLVRSTVARWKQDHR